MPLVSEEFGMLCPVEGCGGFLHNKEGSHNSYGKNGSWVRRVKVCDTCEALVETIETVLTYQTGLFSIDRSEVGIEQ